MSILFATLVLAIAAPESEPEDIEVARAAFERAEVAYRLGRFDEALREYRSAYDAYPRPEFLFNIGQTQRGLRHWRDAAFSFQLYLRDAPDAPDRPHVEALIADLEQRADAQESAIVAVAPVVEEDDPVYEKWWFWVAAGAVVVAAGSVAVAVASNDDTPPTGSLGTFDYR